MDAILHVIRIIAFGIGVAGTFIINKELAEAVEQETAELEMG